MQNPGVTEAQILDAVYEFLGKAASLPPDAELNADTQLLEGGALDSLGILRLAALIEEKFGIQVLDEDFVPENFETVGSLARYIAARLAPA